MALRGLRPVVEIMFGDFLNLAADQVINHAAKFGWMYSGGKPEQDQVHVPLVIRTPMGGRRGYGPTHSQTLEKLFLGVPGLRVLAPCSLADPGALLAHAILNVDGPLLFVENKLLYLLPVQDPSSLEESDIRSIPLSPVPYPLSGNGTGDFTPLALTLTIRDAPPPSLTIATYGYMAELARQAVLRLAYEFEIFCELVVLTQLAPFEIEPVLDSVRRTGRLLLTEEGALSLGWGAEVAARCAEALGSRLQALRRLAAQDLPVPASPPLEAAVLPGVEEIVQTAQKLALAS
jgi:pyruvate/2-oxoglutarate/acetoin dehydrogenase E1 component